MKSLKLVRQFACILASVLGISLLANQAQAANEYFDSNGSGTGSGVTASGTYTWDGPNSWNVTNTGITTGTTAWPDGNNFAIFAAGSDAAALNYTVNVAANRTVAGMALATNGGGTVVVASTGGAVNLFSNAAGQGFFVGGVSTQNLKITAPIGGDAITPLSWGGLFSGTSTGSLYLYGNNTFQGGVNINSSAGININNANSFGTGLVKWGGATNVIAVPNANGVFGGGDAVAGFTITNAMQTRSASNLIFVSSTVAPVNWSGAWTLATGVSTVTTNTAATNLTISGAISGTDATSFLTKAGVATLTLSGPNTYAGKTTIGNGTVVASSLNKVSGGSASSSLGAPTTAANGTIALGATTTAGTLSYVGGGETTDRVIDLAGTTGGGVIDQSGTGLLKFTSNLTATGAGIKTLTLQGATAGTGEIAGKIVDNTSTNKTSVTKSGNGTWTLSGANTYTGATSVNAGTLIMTNATAVPSANALTLGGGTLTNSTGGLKTISGATTLTGNSTLDGADGYTFSGAFTNSGAGRTLTVSNTGLTTFGTVDLSEATGTGRLLTITGAGNTTFGGVIENFAGGGGTAGNLTFNSTYTGTATLNGTNTYSGATILSSGTFVLGNKAAFGTSTVAINGVSVSANTDLNGANKIANATVTLGGTNTFTGSKQIEFGGTVTETASRTVTNNMTANLTFSGPVKLSSNAANNTLLVTGTGNTLLSGVIDNGGTSTASALSKSGGGILTLSGANTYSGGTTVNAGTLKTANGTGSATGSGNVTVAGGTLDVQAGSSITSPAISVTGGTMIVNGTANGPTSITGGSVHGNGTINGAVTVNGGSLAAGNSIGTLNLTGTLALTSGLFDWEFSSGTVSPLTPLAADLTNVSGGLNIAAATLLTVANLGTNPFGVPGSPFVNGTRFTVISYSGAWNNGTFGNAALNNNYYFLGPSPQLWKIKYDDTPLGTVNGGAYAHAVTLTAVPEASTFLVIGLGGVFAFAAVRLGKRLGVNVLEV